MSLKFFFLVVLIIVLGIFVFLKIEVLGSPNSHFNQTTRYNLGKNGAVRTILGLHNVGDARAEYLGQTGPLVIEWFAPQIENVDKSVLQKFADLAGKYTGRQAILVNGGGLDDSTVSINNLDSYKLEGNVQQPGSSVMFVFLTENYLPRPDNELSSTFEETGMVLSLTAHRNFLQNYSQDLNQYLLASMLHEFGNQIGLPETDTTGSNLDCVMNLHAGVNGQPLESENLTEPQDFCVSEKQEIENLKAQYQ